MRSSENVLCARMGNKNAGSVAVATLRTFLRRRHRTGRLQPIIIDFDFCKRLSILLVFHEPLWAVAPLDYVFVTATLKVTRDLGELCLRF